MDDGLPDSTASLRDSVRSFVETELAPIAGDLDRSRTYPDEVIAALADRGYAGLTIAEEYGGEGRSLLDLTVLIEELSAASMPVASVLALNLGVATVVERFGTDAQREAYLPGMTSLETVGALGLSETNAGSDKSGIETVAEREGNEWVLSGRKRWVTNYPEADVVLTYARTGPKDDWPHNVTAFLVPSEKFAVERVWETLGARCVETAAVSLSDVRVPDSAQVGKVGEAIVQRRQVHTGVNVPARAVGIARAALDDARDFARNREQFGGPLADKQGLRWTLAEMAQRVDAARLLTRRAARRADALLADSGEASAGSDLTRATSTAKVHATEAAVENANDAMQVHGGVGYTTEVEVERYLRDARLLTIAGGPNETHRDKLAAAVVDG